MYYTLYYTHTLFLGECTLPRKKIPAIPQSVRFPHNLYEMIVDEAEKKRVSFSEVVVSRTRETFEESEEYIEKAIRLANRKSAKWKAYKQEYLRIRDRKVKRRKAKREEEEILMKQKEAEESRRGFQNDINDMKRIQEHLEGRVSIWVNSTDPNDWLVGDTQPEENFRKLPKGELNPELLDYYNKNVTLL